MLDHRCVINLPHRTDRLDLFDQEVLKVFPDYHYVDGEQTTPTHIGIGRSHLKCIRKAIENGWDSVVIMEDDVQFRPKAREYLLKAIEHAPPGWDILLGGVYFAHTIVPTNEYWSRIGHFCGLHFYIVNSKAYETILGYEESYHIDRWLNHKNRLNCYVTRKMFATQRDGFSDNTKKVTDYRSYLNKFELL